jgi:hypothetical protein
MASSAAAACSSTSPRCTKEPLLSSSLALSQLSAPSTSCGDIDSSPPPASRLRSHAWSTTSVSGSPGAAAVASY